MNIIKLLTEGEKFGSTKAITDKKAVFEQTVHHSEGVRINGKQTKKKQKKKEKWTKVRK